MRNKRTVLLLFTLCILSQTIHAQSKTSFIIGGFYNGGGFSEYVQGFGLVAGIEYMPHRNGIFSIELRTRYGYYTFDDGTKWRENNDGELIPPKNPDKAVLEYSLFSPQVGIVPKLHLHLDDKISIFLENELSMGLMTGNFKYNGQDYIKKNFTETIFSYNIGVGAEYKISKWSLLGSVSYSTLNFKSKIEKNQPINYNERIPNQSAGLMINILFKIPL